MVEMIELVDKDFKQLLEIKFIMFKKVEDRMI